MPIYEYQCKKCGAHMEVLVKSSGKQPKRCRKCGGALEKLFSSSAIQFKGEGWYVTDYARKGSVAEKAEKELSSSDSSGEKPASGDKASGDKDKSKKTPAKKTDKA
jgi:putative FmdB family regulatory protein